MKLSGLHQVGEHIVKPTLDAASIGIAGSALLGYLPPIAAGMSILWISIQVFDYFEKRIKNKGKH